MITEERIKNWKLHDSQRGWFGFELYKQMAKNENIWCITADLGYGLLDAIRDDFPERFLNVGAAEQSMLAIAVGMAMEGKIVFCYTITSFYLRAAEQISLYLDHYQVPVRLVGGGRDDDYKHDGHSHDGTAAQNFINNQKIIKYYPDNKEEVPNIVGMAVLETKPLFISLRR